MNASRSEDLIAAFLNGIASDSELHELNALVVSDRAASLRLIQLGEFDALLADRLSDRGERMQINRLLATHAKSSAATEPTKSKSPVLGFLGNVTSSLNRPIIWSILAVATLFYGSFAVISWNLRNGSLPNGTAGNDSFVATVAGASDVMSPDARLTAASTHGAVIAPGEPLSIASGIVELHLKQGTTLLVEGPVRWSIDGENQATLLEGKLVAKVPHEAIGFTLETPNARIIDLGTEFGVQVNREGAADVQVLRGKVEVRHEGHPDKTLGEGEAVNITRAGVKPVTQDLSKYSSLLEQGKPSVAPKELADVDLAMSMGVEFQTGWTAPQAWGGESPKPGMRYHVGRTTEQVLRSPFSARPQPFLGSELVVHDRGAIVLKHAGETKIELLTLDGGFVNSAKQTELAGPESAISGTIRIQRDSKVSAGVPLTISSRVEGCGNLVVNAGRLTLRGEGRKYSGNWTIQNAQVVALVMDSLGSGNVTIEPKGLLDVRYKWNNPQARLSLAKEAKLNVGFNVSLGEVLVDGKPLPAGAHTLKEVKETYPGYFAGSNDLLTVEIKNEVSSLPSSDQRRR